MKKLICIALIAMSPIAIAGYDDFKSSLGFENTGVGVVLKRDSFPVKLELTIPAPNNEVIKLTLSGPFPDTQRPVFVTHLLNGDDLALIIDGDFSLLYRLYRRVNGEWTMLREEVFSAMRLARRNKITQVKLRTTSIVELRFIPDSEVMGQERKQGTVKATDRLETFEFHAGGGISCDNAPYIYQNNQR